MINKRFFPVKFPDGAYSELDSSLILKTLKGIDQRINVQFPSSGLREVCVEQQQVGKAIVELSNHLRQPIWALRVLTTLGIIGLISMAVWVFSMAFSMAPSGQAGLMETLQGIESVTNEIIFLTIGIIFFATLETRLKRRAALDSLHRLRSFAHVIDMHQLTKDPHDLLSKDEKTDPRFSKPEFLIRYLDYCTDLLAINSKLAALHIQYFQDNLVLNSVSEVEMLSHELSRKIWQKIMILDSMIKEKSRDLPKDVEMN